jgi:hypothetical protein
MSSTLRCKCASKVKHTIDDLKKGHGMQCENGHRWSSMTIDGNTIIYDPNMNESTTALFRLIDEKTVTADDFNRFIAETSPTSINKRVQRQMSPHKASPTITNPGRKIDDKTDHEPADHNDPTSTGRGKSALRKQIKHNKKHPEQFSEAIEFLQENKGLALSECKSKLCAVVDRASLHAVVKKLSQRPSQFDREWLVGLGSLIEKESANA